MKYLLLTLLILGSCTKNKSFTKIAKDFKIQQYIHFDKTLNMLHPDSNKELYKKFNPNKDFSKLKEYTSQFNADYIKHNRIDSKNMIVHLKVSRPDLSKIIPVFSKKDIDLNSLLNKKNLPLKTIKVEVHLRKYKGKWLVLYKNKKTKEK